MTVSTSSNLGDCCWLVMMLCRCSGEHTLYCKAAYVPQLAPLLAHTPHQVRPLEEWDGSGLDGWIANAQFEAQHGLYYRNQEDIMDFVFQFMNLLAGRLGHPRPVFNSVSDMLFDIPAIPEPNIPPIIDVLAVLADPLSGQCPNFRRSEVYEKVITPLRQRFGSVIVTNHSDNSDTGYSLAQIGILSTLARRIIFVANGPSWPVHNVWTIQTPKVCFLEPMRLRFGFDPPINHVADADECYRKCVELGWL